MKNSIIYNELPVVSPLPGGRYWVMREDWIVYVNQIAYVVPKGFITDFASIPKWIRWYVAPATGNHRIPAILHDYMYRYHRLNRLYADSVLLDFCIAEQVNLIKSKLIYRSVRLLGQPYWDKY